MACDPCGVPLVVAPRPACADQVMDAIAARLGVERASLRSPTTRPPAFPLRLGQLTGGPVVDP